MIILKNFCGVEENYEEKFNKTETFLGKAYNKKENILYFFYFDEKDLVKDCDLIFIPDYDFQKQIVDFVKNNSHLHLSGPGGTGKSFQILEIIKYLSFNKKKFYITGSTGTSVSNLRLEGIDSSHYMTIHRWAGIGCFFNKTHLEAEIVIIDEISMIGDNTWKNIYAKLKGIPFITSGDFSQLQPVKDSIIKSFWEPKYLYFNKPKRFEESYFDFLQKYIRPLKELKETLKIIENLKKEHGIKEISLEEALKNKFMILSCKKINSQKINSYEIKKLNKGLIFESEDISPKSENELKIFNSELSIPQSIDLRIGAPVILKKNIDIKEGLTNGTRGFVVSVDPLVVSFNKKDCFIEPIIHKVFINNKVYQRKQVPLVLGWSITIHQAQGLTLSSVAMIPDIFEVCQLYVAMSRVKSFENFILINITENNLI